MIGPSMLTTILRKYSVAPDSEHALMIVDYINTKFAEMDRSKLSLEQFVSEWERKRGKTEEFRVQEDPSLEFFQTIVSSNARAQEEEMEKS